MVGTHTLGGKVFDSILLLLLFFFFRLSSIVLLFSLILSFLIILSSSSSFILNIVVLVLSFSNESSLAALIRDEVITSDSVSGAGEGDRALSISGLSVFVSKVANTGLIVLTSSWPSWAS